MALFPIKVDRKAWGRGKNPFAGSVLSLWTNLSRHSPQGDGGTPSPFSKPFLGIYLFALQKRYMPFKF